MTKNKKVNFDTGLDQIEKVYLSIAAVLVIVIFSLSFVFFQLRIESIIEEENEVFINETATLSARVLNQKIQGDLNILKSMALVLGGLEEFDVTYWINELNDAELISEFSRLGFAMPNGLGYAIDVFGVDYSDQEFLTQVFQNESYVSDIFVNDQNRQMIFYAVPIIRNEELVAAIGFGIYTDEYDLLLSQSAFANESCAYIINSDGDIISRKLSREHIFDTGNVFNHFDLSDSIFNNFQEQLKNQGSGNFEFICSDGQKAHLFYAPIGINDWYIITLVPFSVLDAKTSTIQSSSAVLSLFITMTVGGFMLLLWYTFKKQNQELASLAYIDQLTGFVNKHGFKIETSHVLRDTTVRYAVVIFDIGEFKLFNDKHGYDQGDQLLIWTAKYLSNHLGKHEILARVRADQFAMLMIVDNEYYLQQRLEDLIASMPIYQLPSQVSHPLVLYIGVYKIVDQQLPVDTYLDRAQLALKQAKLTHQSNITFYDDRIRKQLIIKTDFERELLEALEKEEFIIYIQPKIDLKTNDIIGAEALVRWQHPTKGLIPPDLFIKVLESNGLITKLDDLVLNKVCQLQQRLVSQGINDLVLSVNTSRKHFLSKNYVEGLQALVNRYGVEPSLIELELTENIFVEDTQQLKHVIKELRNVGFLISIDDFGSGYSSLNILKDIEVDTIKIDRVFLEGTNDIEKSELILRSVINMTKKLNILTLAEGVETQSQANFLSEIGCDYAQGYLFYKPMKLSAFEKMIVDLHKKVS